MFTHLCLVWSPGGFRPQAQVASEAVRVLNQAKALQDSGCFAIVLECVPAPIAAAVTKELSIPTIGIGAGPQCSGQVRGLRVGVRSGGGRELLLSRWGPISRLCCTSVCVLFCAVLCCAVAAVQLFNSWRPCTVGDR